MVLLVLLPVLLLALRLAGSVLALPLVLVLPLLFAQVRLYGPGNRRWETVRVNVWGRERCVPVSLY